MSKTPLKIDAKFQTSQYDVAGASYLPTEKHFEAEEDYDEYLAEKEINAKKERRLYEEKIEDSLPKLYKLLVDRGDYTKSFNDFTSQFYNEESRLKLFNYLDEKNVYTKGYEAFNEQFFSNDEGYYGDYFVDGTYTNNTIELDYATSWEGLFDSFSEI